MTRGQRFQIACGGVVIAAVVIGVSLVPTTRMHAQPGGNGNGDSRIQIGFAIAPVPLNMAGKNPALVGLGSYIVNTEGCNDCHDAGPPSEYAKGGNPYWGQPKVVNTNSYLGGGRDFLNVAGGTVHIISRNITPDKTGLPAGLEFDDFVAAIRKGIDDDHLHPPCAADPANPNCIPPPFDGNLLQVMPWPNFKDWTDNDLKAVYEYLKAVPCLQGQGPDTPPNRCP